MSSEQRQIDRAGAAALAATVGLTVYGQLIVKTQVNKAGSMPDALGDKIDFLTGLLVDPLVLTAIAAALLGSLTWIAALARLDLSRAYPFTATTFILVLIGSATFLSEEITAPKAAGVLMIVTGLIVGHRSAAAPL